MRDKIGILYLVGLDTGESYKVEVKSNGKPKKRKLSRKLNHCNISATKLRKYEFLIRKNTIKLFMRPNFKPGLLSGSIL